MYSLCGGELMAPLCNSLISMQISILIDTKPIYELPTARNKSHPIDKLYFRLQWRFY